MYAVLVTVDLEADRSDESKTHLHEFTIPAVKSQSGFARGVWLRSSDNSNGCGVMLFDTEENATAAVAAAKQGPPPGAPVSIRSVEMFEVVGEA